MASPSLTSVAARPALHISRRRALAARRPATYRSLTTAPLASWQHASLSSTIAIPISFINGPLQQLRDGLSKIWEGILLAVPKKKPSKPRQLKRRHHGGKAHKDEQNVVSCSSCGRPKRAHVLCVHCVSNILDGRKGDDNWAGKKKTFEQVIGEYDAEWKEKRRQARKTGIPAQKQAAREAVVRPDDHPDLAVFKEDYNFLNKSPLWKSRWF